MGPLSDPRGVMKLSCWSRVGGGYLERLIRPGAGVGGNPVDGVVGPTFPLPLGDSLARARARDSVFEAKVPPIDALSQTGHQWHLWHLSL